MDLQMLGALQGSGFMPPFFCLNILVTPCPHSLSWERRRDSDSGGFRRGLSLPLLAGLGSRDLPPYLTVGRAS